MAYQEVKIIDEKNRVTRVTEINGVNKAAQALGSLGGLAGRGKSKARTSEQARKAVNTRWAKTPKYRAKEVRPECWQIFERGSNVPLHDTSGEHVLIFDNDAMHQELDRLNKV